MMVVDSSLNLAMEAPNSGGTAQTEHQRRKKKCFKEGRRKIVAAVAYGLCKEGGFLKFK